MVSKGRRLLAAMILAGLGPVAPHLAADNCDIDRGARLFAKCAMCHPRDETGVSGAGPNLAGIIGRTIADADGFPYSVAMSGMDGIWTPERLDAFLAAPMAYIPGTTMGFGGLRNPADRENLLCYLASEQ
ncbi:c-type cytochrome [Kineobactrum sediminis]|nr:c-type cytochrome [Kineobactrum sediminis]